MENEPSKMRTWRYNQLTNRLLHCKLVLVNHFNIFYPELKYGENVLKHYSQEEKDNGTGIWGWKIDLCRGIEELLSEKQTSNNSDKTDDKKPQKIDGLLAKPTSGSELLALYKPTLSSPKGFCDVAGMDEIKEQLKKEFLDYVNDKELAERDYKEYGIQIPRGFLFYGPPGCGKTYIAQALAAEGDLPMYKMDISKIGSSFINKSAKNIERAFKQLEKESETTDKPIVLFMDEVDSFAFDRNEVKGGSPENLKTLTALLKAIDETKDKNILIIAATNKYNLLDDAFISRFDHNIYFGLPNRKQMKFLIKNELNKREKGQNLACDEKTISALANDFRGYSPRSIGFIIDKAAKIAKDNDRAEISYFHIKEALDNSQIEKTKEYKYKQNW